VTVSPARVHPSAYVHPDARLAPDVVLGPGVVVEADVEVGTGSEVLAGTVLHGGSRVGARCRLGPYAVVGGVPMDSHFDGEASLAVLGDDVTLREFATVHRATGAGARTTVGTGSLLMSYVHVSHNCTVGRGCVLTTAVQLGGHSQIGDHAVLGSGALIHQFCRIGEYAMFGAASAANMDVLPFTMARGNPARHYRLNRVGLLRHGIDGERYRALEQAVRALRQRDRARLDELARTSADVRRLLEFADASERGVARFVGGG
jgi:UDP-N-acetylglucosamine acyltransferase